MYAKYEEMGLPKFPIKLGGNERDTFITLNLCRADPIFFINNFVEPCRSRYFKSFQYRDFANVVRTTHEGIEATNSLVDYMTEAEKMPALNWDSDLAEIAKANIKNLTFDLETMVKKSNLTKVDLSGFGINTKAKLKEFIEVGSSIGFEAFTKIMICDGDFQRSNYSIRDKEYVYAGICHEKLESKIGCVTYIILGDKSIHDVTDLTLSNKVSKAKKLNQKSLKSLFENVKDNAENNKNGNDTTRYEDLNYFKNIGPNRDESYAPMMSLFDHSAAMSQVDEKFVAKNTSTVTDLKQVTRYNTHRENEDDGFRETKVEGWSQFELGRKNIIDKAELKPPSYFRLNYH